MSREDHIKFTTRWVVLVSGVVGLIIGLASIFGGSYRVGALLESKADRSEVLSVERSVGAVSERVASVEADNESQADFDELLYDAIRRVEDKLDVAIAKED